MKLSNLPPGVTDAMIEENATGREDHRSEEEQIHPRRHVKLKKLLPNGERECWVTVFRDGDHGVDLVIGAATKSALQAAFNRIAPEDVVFDKANVSRARFRKVTP